MIDTVAPLIECLKSHWHKLLEEYQIDQQFSDLFFQEIISAYSQSHRHYHTLNHLIHIFQELDSCEVDSSKTGIPKLISNEVLWAVWYHDFVYKPGASANESKSALKAKESMSKLGIQQTSIDKVIKLIMATKTHQCESIDSGTQIFLDADMAILGSDKICYLSYCEAVRKEHSNVPDFIFNRGRKKFLSSVLKQESIFVNSFFFDKYELAAVKNIELEISALNQSKINYFTFFQQ